MTRGYRNVQFVRAGIRSQWRDELSTFVMLYREEIEQKKIQMVRKLRLFQKKNF